MQLIKFELNNEFTWVRFSDPASGWWVARCDALGLTASGETYQELMGDVQAVMTDLFRMLLEEGTLVPYLIERGGRVHFPQQVPAAHDASFDFPWGMRAARANEGAYANA